MASGNVQVNKVGAIRLVKVVVAVEERRTRGGDDGLENIGSLLIGELVEGKVG